LNVLLLSDETAELTDITERIQRKFRGRVQEFRLDTAQEGLILYGFTRTYYEKQLVQQAVLCSTERPIAANEIVVG
jgi:hypothetical protein